jgi:cytochrome c oxidase accessory protein FixG
MSNRYDLHESRLATTDEHGHRVTLYPEDIKGIWKKRRKLVYSVLILFYLILPWIYIGGKQVVLLDLAKREFYIFGQTFYGHDGPLIIFLLLGFIFLIAFVTSIWGRVWCGWACPQTVFIDTIYRGIERFVEGKARERKRLDESELSFEKAWKKTAKWILFTLVSLHIVHSFLGYFVGTHHLVEISLQSPSQNIELFITMLIMTAIVLFDFGWFREQFCVIACPYGRFQSVFMDESTKVVGYDPNRGEPRRGVAKTKEDEGDCINCFRCVKACPTGIDIRRGTQQLECINCTMCIDACDEIMEKLKKPSGLIRYTSENELEGKPEKKSFRVYIYAAAFSAVVVGLIVSLNLRMDVKTKFFRVQGEPYSQIAEENYSLINRYKVRAHYYGSDKVKLNYEVPQEFSGKYELVAPTLPAIISGNTEVFLFIKFNKDILTNGSANIILDEVLIKDDKEIERKKSEVKIVGPL